MCTGFEGREFTNKEAFEDKIVLFFIGEESCLLPISNIVRRLQTLLAVGVLFVSPDGSAEAFVNYGEDVSEDISIPTFSVPYAIGASLDTILRSTDVKLHFPAIVNGMAAMDNFVGENCQDCNVLSPADLELVANQPILVESPSSGVDLPLVLGISLPICLLFALAGGYGGYRYRKYRKERKYLTLVDNGMQAGGNWVNIENIMVSDSRYVSTCTH